MLEQLSQREETCNNRKEVQHSWAKTSNGWVNLTVPNTRYYEIFWRQFWVGPMLSNRTLSMVLTGCQEVHWNWPKMWDKKEDVFKPELWLLLNSCVHGSVKGCCRQVKLGSSWCFSHKEKNALPASVLYFQSREVGSWKTEKLLKVGRSVCLCRLTDKLYKHSVKNRSVMIK